MGGSSLAFVISLADNSFVLVDKAFHRTRQKSYMVFQCHSFGSTGITIVKVGNGHLFPQSWEQRLTLTGPEGSGGEEADPDCTLYGRNTCFPLPVLDHGVQPVWPCIQLSGPLVLNISEDGHHPRDNDTRLGPPMRWAVLNGSCLLSWQESLPWEERKAGSNLS